MSHYHPEQKNVSNAVDVGDPSIVTDGSWPEWQQQFHQHPDTDRRLGKLGRHQHVSHLHHKVEKISNAFLHDFDMPATFLTNFYFKIKESFLYFLNQVQPSL